MWTYLRNRVRDAVLAGVNDAMIALDGDDPAPALADLRARLAKALPGPTEDDEAPKRKRGA